MERDLKSNIKVIPVLFEAAAGASEVGAIIDTAGFESLTYVITSGTITTGSFAATLAESDAANMAGEAAVDSELLIGDAIAFAVDDDDTTKTIGSVGKERYNRLTLTGASTPVGQFSVVAILGNPYHAPVDQDA